MYLFNDTFQNPLGDQMSIHISAGLVAKEKTTYVFEGAKNRCADCRHANGDDRKGGLCRTETQHHGM
jgi:ribosomal protein S14